MQKAVINTRKPKAEILDIHRNKCTFKLRNIDYISQVYWMHGECPLSRSQSPASRIRPEDAQGSISGLVKIGWEAY